jgi:hypothetical protein
MCFEGETGCSSLGRELVSFQSIMKLDIVLQLEDTSQTIGGKFGTFAGHIIVDDTDGAILLPPTVPVVEVVLADCTLQ